MPTIKYYQMRQNNKILQSCHRSQFPAVTINSYSLSIKVRCYVEIKLIRLAQVHGPSGYN